MGSSENRFRAGAYTADTALRTIASLAFQPAAVTIRNEVTGAMLEWVQGMEQDSAFKTVAAGTRTKITSDGIVVGSDDEGATLPFGTFTVGADSDIAGAGKVRWTVQE